MSEVNPNESDSEKRPSIVVDSDIVYMEVNGAEGETVEDIEEVFDRKFEQTLESVQENIEKIQDKTFR